MSTALRRPLTALVATLNNGRALQGLFLAMLALSVGTVGFDLQNLVANAPEGTPGSQRLEPAPMELPTPGDQTRPYLPRTMPLGPGRGKPDLPGYFGPLDGTVMADPMKFFVGDNGRASALGRIDRGAAKRLNTFLEDNDRAIGELVLHSPGGSVSDALAMARSVRAAGMSTRVPANGYCASSCPLLLSGGLYRRAGKESYVGVHQVYAPGEVGGSLARGMRDAQSVTAAAQTLLVEMDVDPKLWIKALQTPPAQLYVFTPEELARYGLANGRIARTVPSARPSDEAAEG